MKMMVTTPTLTPRIVNAERSLFARNVSNAIRADSLMSSNLIFLYCQLPIADCQFKESDQATKNGFQSAIGNWKSAIIQREALRSDPISPRATRATFHSQFPLSKNMQHPILPM